MAFSSYNESITVHGERFDNFVLVQSILLSQIASSTISNTEINILQIFFPFDNMILFFHPLESM